MDDVPESAKNYRDHASTETVFHRLTEGFAFFGSAVFLVVAIAIALSGVGRDGWAFGLLFAAYIGALALAVPLRMAIFTSMPDLRSSEEALWVKFAWRWRRLDMRTVQAFEMPGGVRICSPQLPRQCLGLRQDQTDDHRHWKGFGVSDKIPAYDSLLYNLEAGGAQFAPW